MKLKFLKSTVLLYLASCFTASLIAQPSGLFHFNEFRKALENETRSPDGSPGPAYFQNTAKYTIDADFDPETGLLNGRAQIRYTNNSPDTLQKLVLRVYMNFFKKGTERDFPIPSTDLHEGVRFGAIQANGASVLPPGPQMERAGTVLPLSLKQPLLPGKEIDLHIEWETHLPLQTAVRMGQYGKQNWFVAYWYPHIAVYDDISGWDTHPFTGSAEFYYDFNDFEVNLTLPGQYMVWATGLLQNKGEIYTPEVQKRLEQAAQSDEVIAITRPAEVQQKQVMKKAESRTWTFHASQVPDFAFAVSPSYIWDATSVGVAPGKRVQVGAVYPEGADFDQVAQISGESIRLLSDEIIGVPFPYPKLTAFNGSGGMEFPMMINDGDAGYAATVHVTSHEIGHNYFPFYVMTNESYYAFMDEGLVSFLPREVEKALVEGAEPFADIIRRYSRGAGSMREFPLMARSYAISDYPAYRLHAYSRPATAFYLLRGYLGDKVFGQALRAYVERWAKKHPTPYDFFNTFEHIAEEKLDWFWKPWFFAFGYPDLAIQHADFENNTLRITNPGGLPLPIELRCQLANGGTEMIIRKASAWKDKSTLEIRLPDNTQAAFLNENATIPDINPGDNKR